MPLFPISFPPRLLLPMSEGDESPGGVRYIAEAQEPWSKEPLKHFVNSEFWSPRAKIHIFVLTLGFFGVPPVLSLSKEMGPISCMRAGAREVVKAVAKLLLALGFSACRREQMCFPFLTGGRCGVQPSATPFIFFFWLLSSFLWLWKHLPHPPVPHTAAGAASTLGTEDKGVTSLTCFARDEPLFQRSWQ